MQCAVLQQQKVSPKLLSPNVLNNVLVKTSFRDFTSSPVLSFCRYVNFYWKYKVLDRVSTMMSYVNDPTVIDPNTLPVTREAKRPDLHNNAA